MGDEKKSAIGSRERVAQVGAMFQELIQDAEALMEFHVATPEDKAEGSTTRRQLVVSAGHALTHLQEAWKHYRDAHGGRG